MAQSTQVFSQAVKHHQAGSLAKAERLYRRALAANPQHADSLHLLGLIAVQSGRPGQAAELIGKALALKPLWADAHNSLGIALRALGRKDEALAAYRSALRCKPDFPVALTNLACLLGELGQHEEAVSACREVAQRWPDLPEAHFNLGRALQRLGRHEDAAAAYRRCIALKPALVFAHLNLGVTLKELGRHVEALGAYRKALEIDPACAEAHNNIGVVLQAIGDPEAAATAARRAIELKPHYAEPYNNLGMALADNGLFEDAERALHRAIELKPDYANAYCNLSVVQKERGNLHGAVTSGRRAIELQPDYAAAYNNLGAALKELHHSAEALACFDKALSVDSPGFASPMVNKAGLLLELGQIKEAREAADQALTLNERSGGAWHVRGELKRFSGDDPDIARMQAVLQSADTVGLKLSDRINLEFALGKAWMDAGDADRAFEHLHAANRRRRASLSYDPAANSAWMARIAQVITPEWLQQFHGAGDPSELPIFIIGMPRSGTSLVEQILASHPAVHGAGELSVLRQLLDGLAYPEAMRQVAPCELTQLGRHYVQQVSGLSPGAQRVVDKMPMNFFFAGLISVMLPNARIIHCIRDPMDTGLSCYLKNFHTGVKFAFDLREIGLFYRGYEALMAHWRVSLPAQRFAEVVYEELVGDIETQARRLLSFCGLEWDPACLAFHNTARQVRTVSAFQVRQPIYRDSIGRWRRYARHLAPLRESLGLEPVDNAADST